MALNKNQIYWWWEFNNNVDNDPAGYATAMADFIAAMTVLNSYGYKHIICTTRGHQVTDVYTEMMASKPAAMKLYGGLKTSVADYNGVDGTTFMSEIGGMDSLVGWANHAASVTIIKNLTGNKLVFLDNESCFDPNVDIAGGGSAWTQSPAKAGEYYHSGSGLSQGEPINLAINGTIAPTGTVGSLAVGEWAWGNNDSLPSNRVYVKITGGADPDSQSAGYVYAMYDNGTIPGGMDYLKSEMAKALRQLPRGLTYTSHPAYAAGAWSTSTAIENGIWNKNDTVNRMMFRELGRQFRFMERFYDSPRSVEEGHANYVRRGKWRKRLDKILKLRPSPNRRRKFQLVYFFENDANFWLDAEIPTAMGHKRRTEDLIIYPGSGRTREQAATDICAILETI